jgi:hypothetical protein
VLDAGSRTGPRVIRRDDVTETVRGTYTEDSGRFTLVSFRSNVETDQLDGAADSYLDAAQAEYSLDEKLDVPYVGLLPIEPDGAIQQVTFSIGVAGTFTRASRNMEHNAFVPPYRVRRRAEKLDDLADRTSFLQELGRVLLSQAGLEDA